MYVYHRFELNAAAVKTLRNMKPKFGYGQLGEILYYRTYSRTLRDEDGNAIGQEHWPDTVIRVVEGTFSIRKDHYIKNHIEWDEEWWQEYATRFAISMFKMEWLPPGRGLNHMGAKHIYERGSMALYNCGATKLYAETLDTDLAWLMDALMLGVGVGFHAIRDDLRAYTPRGKVEYVIPDTREGWVESTRLLIRSYISSNRPDWDFVYDEIRDENTPIKTFGGMCNGPGDLILLHDRIRYLFSLYAKGLIDVVMLKTDIANAIGVCVVSGNVRRSAELGAGEIDDTSFMDMKNYDLYPYRSGWGYMSNNSVYLRKDEDFERLGEIAKRVVNNGEPGYINMQNLPFGRIGKKMKGLRKDKADLFNPCLTGDTKVCVADGRGFVPIRDLLNKDVPVYCINERDEVVIRTMRNPRMTGRNQRILKIILDTGDILRVTENHKIMLRDRSFVEAKNLKFGDSVAMFNRYTPIKCKGESYHDRYISIGYSGRCIAEHKLIIGGNSHTHHIDENRLNNHPSNLEVFDHLSEHAIGSNNGNWSGYTNQELLNLGVSFCKKLGRRFSTKEWQEFGPVKSFQNYRKDFFGSVRDFAELCADIAEVRNDPVDPRTLKYLNEIINQGYEADLIDNTVMVLKFCESCSNSFWIEATRREQACCSHSCNNKLRDYSKNVEGQRKTFAQKRETLRERQLKVYVDLKLALGREPTKEEWKQDCKANEISSEMCRKGSPFQSWNELKKEAFNYNHKVIEVIEDGFEDVYNGTVDQYHNMIIGGWVNNLESGRQVERGVVSPQCGEIPLQDKELCDVAETAPTRCRDENGKFDPKVWLQACEYCTFYCNTVQLLPTHQPVTNKIMAHNRRIGVSLFDFIGWKDEVGMNKVIKYMRQGYKRIRRTSDWASDEAGVPRPIRNTTIKPGGTTPRMAGKRSGIGFSNFRYMIRRVRVQQNSAMERVLLAAGIPHEPDYYSPNTTCFEIPVDTGPGKTAEEASLWEQASNLVLVQREWSDNAVSNTLMFKPKWVLKRVVYGNEIPDYMKTVAEIFNLSTLDKGYEDKYWKVKVTKDENGNVIEIKEYQYNENHEESDVEAVLSSIAPLTKSVSVLPHTAKGVYKQMPEEGITKEEYEKRKASIKEIDWNQFVGSEGVDEKYCQGETCEREGV